MAVLEGTCAGAAAVTMIAWNAVVSERQAQDNHRSANEGEELRKRCERLLSSAQVTPTISAFDGPEGGAESPASIGSGDIVDQASMLSPSCAAESCWEGDSPEASPSPHMYRELVVLEGPPLSPLSHMLPELPEDVDFTAESLNATALPPGGCDLSPDFYLRVPSPPRFGLHHRRHTFSGNRPRTFSEYTPGCIGNSSDDGDSSLKCTDQEKLETNGAAVVLTRVEEMGKASHGRGCTRGRARYATYSNGDVLRKLGDDEPFANDGVAAWSSGTGEDTFRSRRNGVSDVGGKVYPIS